MISEIRTALRSLAKSPGFSAIAIVTLALGIGMSTSSFSITNALLLRSVPYEKGDQLLRVVVTGQQSRNPGHSPGNAIDLQRNLSSFSELAISANGVSNYSEKGQSARQINSLSVGTNFLRVLRIQPQLGRDFAPDEDQPGKGNVVILSHRCWVRRFGSDPGVIGRTLRIDSAPCTVIGVLPEGFHAPLVWGSTEMIRPFTVWPGFPSKRDQRWLDLTGRLHEGVSRTEALSELATINTQLVKAYPKENTGLGIRLENLATVNIDGASRTLSYLMTGLALLVLVIACANLAGLLMARSFSRTREFAIRSALGASRFQLMRPLLTESMILALAGGVLGLLMAAWTTSILSSQIRIANEPGFDMPMDLRVLAFAGITAVATGFFFGLMPALLISRTPASDSLKEGERGSSSGRSHHRIKSALVVAEIALALVLVGTSASFTLATRNLMRRNLGWIPQGLYTGAISLPWNNYGKDPERREFVRAFLERATAIPGVEKVTLANAIPFYTYFSNMGVVAEGQTIPIKGQEPQTLINPVSTDYFATLQIPLIQGSWFSRDMKEDSKPVAIINQSLGRRLWPNENPVGKRLRNIDKTEWLEVVGVVGDVRMAVNISALATSYQLYRPLIQTPSNTLSFAIRTHGPAESVGNPIQRIVTEIDPDLPVLQGSTVVQAMETAMANMDLITVNFTVFAGMGLLIAAIGIYGVISHLTAQRTRDIGVRIALGARRGAILHMVLRQGTVLLVIGLAIGAILTYLVNALLQQSMSEFGLPGIWLQFVTMLLIAGVTLLASFLPARRASRIDPVQALRSD